MTPISSDLEAHVMDLLARYQCPLQFYEAGAYLMGTIACPTINANPDQALVRFGKISCRNSFQLMTLTTSSM